MDSGPGFSCAFRNSRVPPQSKNASEPKVYRCGNPSVPPYQASDSLMSRTVREIWASGPSVSVVMIGLSCRRRALVPGEADAAACGDLAIAHAVLHGVYDAPLAWRNPKLRGAELPSPTKDSCGEIGEADTPW